MFEKHLLSYLHIKIIRVYFLYNLFSSRTHIQLTSIFANSNKRKTNNHVNMCKPKRFDLRTSIKQSQLIYRVTHLYSCR